MNTDFKYFFWAGPEKGKPLYALYDVLDNHMMLQSYDYNTLFELAYMLRPKTKLEVIELTNVIGLVEKNITDNSVVQNWGLAGVPNEFYTDVRILYNVHNRADIYFENVMIKYPTLVETHVEFDAHKQDLQNQIFFFYHCVETLYKSYSDEMKKVIEDVIIFSESYDNAESMLLSYQPDNNATGQLYLDFLRRASLAYE